MPSEFVPSQDLSRLSIRMQTAVGSDLTETDKLIKKAEDIVAARPEVTRISRFVGGFGGRVNQGQPVRDPRPAAGAQAGPGRAVRPSCAAS